jgi:hypothetical protein
MKVRPLLSAAGKFLSRFFIFLGLPLLAWGLDDLSGFFSNPIRGSFAVLATTQALILAYMVYISPPETEPKHRYDIAPGTLPSSRRFLFSQPMATGGIF